MDINYLIQILQNKITILNNAKGQAFAAGNLDQVNAIEKDLLETQNTFQQLTMLVDMAQAAKAANTTPAEVVSTGLDAVQNPTPEIQGPSASAVINGYDISAYATDPAYEDKIRAILSKMPVFSIVSDIDAYIQSVAQGSPVTGDMVYKSSQQYGVDMPLMMAIMHNDSTFGTLGVGARTFNPGNVGNTGSAEKTYSSWQEGVTAVADWLNRHRVVTPTIDPAPVQTPVEIPVVEPVDDTAPVVEVATTTPAVILPTTPITVATSTIPFIIPSINATTTSPFATSTNPFATSTPPVTETIIPPIVIPPFATSTDPMASSTPPTVSTSTPPVIPPEATSTPPVIPPVATSTDPIASPTPPVTGTSTPPVIPPEATTTPEFVAPPVVTPTPEITATSTQATRWFGKSKKKKV